MKRSSFTFKFVSVVTALTFMSQVFLPTAVFALTGGPSAPEFSSFEPVSTTNMVNVFSGDFTYNLPVIEIPGPEGSGYSMSLSYHSGVTPDEEASWVGYGWTLNPGAVNRSKRGNPDDWKGENIDLWNQAPPNRTVTVGGGVGGEAFSIDASAHLNIRYNNYKGFGYTAGVGLGLGGGVVSLGFNVTDGEGSYSLALNPAAALKSAMSKKDKSDESEDQKNKESTEKGEKEAETESTEKSKEKVKPENMKNTKVALNKNAINPSNLTTIGSSYGIFSYNVASFAAQNTAYNGTSIHATVGLLGTPAPLPAGIDVNMMGSYSQLNNVDHKQLDAFGYMYSYDASGDDVSMDYQTEKLNSYTKQDRFLGMPFNNADQFMISGEGIGGGFRMYNRGTGHFRPNKTTSTTTIGNVGLEIEMGLDWGGGADVGVGIHTLETGEWSSLSSFVWHEEDGDEPNFFRFNNDLGGYLFYGDPSLSNTLAVQRAGISGGGTKGFKTYNPVISSIATNLVEHDNYKRSSYIGYSTNKEMSETISVNGENIHYRAYEKHPSVYNTSGHVLRNLDNQIGEISVVNESGIRYNYGLPVYSRYESSMTYDMESRSDLFNNYLAYKNIGTNKTKVGREDKAPYASTFLLTSIYTPDYVDRTNNGASEDDFGGYTMFTYNRTQGSNDKSGARSDDWYNWRMPYNGLFFNRNELSSIIDDMGSVTDGQKEVYYLDRIDTKTHYALFVTGPREDGYEAKFDKSAAASQTSGLGSSSLHKLKRIELYAKQENGSPKLIKTTHFEYTYELCDGIYNSSGDPGDAENDGKLTLKKVWFEYEGIVNAMVSPYEFTYEYPTTTYPAPYAAMSNYGGYTQGDQNPNYSPFSVDPWGNYQYDGPQRYDDMKTWVNQANASANFDPAAWQLKQIKLPSGGEIHVQYEQDDYLYVQDKAANIMVDIYSAPSDTKFYLNPATANVSSAEVPAWTSMISKQYLNKRIYFKFLYKLLGTVNPQIDHCNAEYITGYAKVTGVSYDASTGSNRPYIQLSSGGHTFPKEVCKDFVKTQRAGKLSTDTYCDPGDEVIKGNGAEEIVKNFLVWGFQMIGGSALRCQKMNESLSYFRVPAYNPKKGGGLRVKRLLMYDQGLETGAEVLYGSEYLYRTFDNETNRYTSSGIATNEPPSIREENVLVDFIERFGQSFVDKLIAGKDKEQSEGPLGESVMPGASVGYSQVITRGIHSGKTNTGFNVNQFYTAKDYPFTYQMTSIDSEMDNLNFPGGFINKITNRLWATQGFKFEINSMHGAAKAEQSYSGLYVDIFGSNDKAFDLKKSVLVSSTDHYYYEPGEYIPVLKGIKTTEMLPMGQEMELNFESRWTKDLNDDGNIEGDLSAGIIPPLPVPIPYVTAFPSLTFSNSEMFTHSTTKVIRYPVVEKKTTTFDNNVWHINETLAYDGNNGKPLITRTYDAYSDLSIMGTTHDGAITTYNLPASHEYDAMGQKAIGEKSVIVAPAGIQINKVIVDGQPMLEIKVLQQGADACDVLEKFGGGDFIRIIPGDGDPEPPQLYHTGAIEGTRVTLHPTSYGTENYTTEMNVRVDIIRSGRTNQLNNIATEIVAYDDNLSNWSIDPYELSLRQTVESSLNSWLTSSIAAAGAGNPLPKLDIGSGSFTNVKFRQSDGSCGNFVTAPLEEDYILFEDGYLNVYRPSDPDINYLHPMVDALYDYLITGISYEFSDPQQHADFQSSGTPLGCVPSPCIDQSQIDINCNDFQNGGGIQLSGCSNNPGVMVHEGWTQATPHQVDNPNWTILPGNTVDFGGSHMELETMRNQQLVDLNTPFTQVNNGTHTIGDFFKDIDHAVASSTEGFTRVYYDPATTDWVNSRTILERKHPGHPNSFFGATLECHDDMYNALCRYPASLTHAYNPYGYTVDLSSCYPAYCGGGGNSGSMGTVSNLPMMKGSGIGSTGSTFNEKDPPQTGFDYSYRTFSCWGDESLNPFPNGPSYGYFSIDGEGYLQIEHSTGLTRIDEIRFYSLDPICSIYLGPDFNNSATVGSFKVDTDNGNLTYIPAGADCSPMKVHCLTFCNEIYPNNGIENILSSSVKTFNDNWPYSDEYYYPPNNTASNDYEIGARGKWRQKSSYIFNADITGIGSAAGGGETYNSGYYVMDMYDHQNPNANLPDRWQLASEVTMYSPNGFPVEERNILDMYTTAKYGYNHQIPYLTAKNATYNDVYFESFEKEYESGTYLEEGVDQISLSSSCSVVNSDYHSGTKCAQCIGTLMATNIYIYTKEMDLTQQYLDEGMWVKMWMKSATPYTMDPTVGVRLFPNTSTFYDVTGELLAQRGEWALYGVNVPKATLALLGSQTMTVVVWADMSSANTFYIDDVRIQPAKSQMTCYVYDPNTQRLLTSFDDQHFGLYYQYNAQGQLVRKQKETARGLKTITETQYNQPKVERPTVEP